MSAVNDNGLGENQQHQRYIADEILQWMFQFLSAKELFTKIRFTCNRMDNIVCTSIPSLHCQGLCIKVLKFVHTILSKETQLQELNLTANNIGDNEATKIAKLFPLMQQLQILNLSWNKIGDIGAIAIANSVKYLEQLQMLDISCNPIEGSGITAISHATKELTKLKQLEISEKYSKKVYTQMQQVFNQKGTELNLISCDVDDACAIALAKMLPHLTQLQELYLSENQIGDTGATTIAESICKLTQLQELSLHNNQVGDVGAAALAHSISKLQQLKQLWLSRNLVGDIGAITIANSISNLTRLNCWSLRNNDISEPAKQQLQEQFGDKFSI